MEDNNSKIINIISQLKVKNDLLNGQVVQLTLLLEYLYERLNVAIEAKKIDLDLELEEYPMWVDKRVKEIQDTVEQANLEKIQKDLNDQVDLTAANINLSDEGV